MDAIRVHRSRPGHGHPLQRDGVEIEPVTHQGAPFVAGVPTFEDYDDHRGRLLVTEAEGERMVAVLGNCRAQLLKQPGANVVGRTVGEMTMLAMFLVGNAAHQLAALSIGEPDYFTEPEAAVQTTVEDTVLRPRTVDRAWDYLVHRLPG